MNPNEPAQGLVEAAPRQLHEPSAQVSNVGNLLQLAIQSGIGADQLERLVALQEHVMEKQAKDEFFRAMAGFHSECPVVGKNRTAKVRSRKGEESSYSYGYADLAMVAETIRPLCEKYGFSYSFQQRFEKSIVETICVVRHEGGHSESTTFAGPSDNESGQSAMQKVIGATTSARRLALVLAFGLSIGEDMDGRGNLPDEQPNPNRNQNAPSTQPRGKRPEPVTPPQVIDINARWKQHVAGAHNSKDDFSEWVQGRCAREFEVAKASQWTQDDLAKCNAAIQAAERGEV